MRIVRATRSLLLLSSTALDLAVKVVEQAAKLSDGAQGSKVSHWLLSIHTYLGTYAEYLECQVPIRVGPSGLPNLNTRSKYCPSQGVRR